MVRRSSRVVASIETSLRCHGPRRRAIQYTPASPLATGSPAFAGDDAPRMMGGWRKTMGRLDGRVAIVTGGAKGIGRHYSQALAAEGARVMIADIEDGRALADEIGAKSGANSVASATFDVSDEAQVQRMVAQTIERFGQIDILVNNAALYAKLQPVKATDIDVDLWDRVMAVNVRGAFLMVKHVAPHM